MISLLDFLFPKRCLSCRKFLKEDGLLCSHCEEQWPSLKAPYCRQCVRPFSSDETSSHLCFDCLKQEKACCQVQAAGLYQGILLEMMIRLKYKGEERIASYLGERMSKCLGSGDLILPIPLHKKRLRQRGYNQSLLMAKNVSQRSGIPFNPFLLYKKIETPPQAELKGEERRKNLKGVFDLRHPEKIKDKKILLVDDVYTTGATIETAAKLLLQAGALSVQALVGARAV